MTGQLRTGAPAVDGDLPQGRPAPWYLGAVRVVHTTAGVLGTFSGAGLLGGAALEFTSGTERALALPGLSAGVAGMALGVLFLLSGESIRGRRRRTLSLACGILLFFTGPLFVLGLLSVIALTRQRVLDYYGSGSLAGGFPVLPARQ